MQFLWKPESPYNAANLITFGNLTSGLLSIYFVTQQNYFVAIILLWIGGAFDVFDGRVARKYNLSNEFGIQLDSYADFLSFVLVPIFIIFQAVFRETYTGLSLALAAAVSIFYIISGLRRLIYFNINADAGEVDDYFTGVPTPMAAIIIWLIYLLNYYGAISASFVMFLLLLTAISLNSRIKVRHL